MSESDAAGRGQDAGLAPTDLERLAAAAYLAAEDDESEAALARAHQAYLERGDREGAARAAFWLAFGLLARGAMAPASGWLTRADRLLDEGAIDCVVRGYLLIPAGIHRVVQGDPGAALELFERAAEIARRFGDRDLAALACSCRGRALIRLERVDDGLARLDEAMVSVIAGDVTPVLAGDIYCSVLEACQELLDVRRASEWTSALARWCASQQDLVRYRAECLVYRAELMQWRGDWTAAEQDARDACDLLRAGRGRAAIGAAYYRLGDIHRLRGAFSRAEEAYTRAHACGRKPQPGLALLHLARGDTAAAASAIRSVLLEARTRVLRTRALAAAVDILLAAGDVDGARAAAGELTDIATAVGTPLLRAMSAHARGAVLLSDGDVEGASAALRQAADLWRELGLPYDEAQTTLLLADVCQRRGDGAGRRLELDAARQLFTQLHAEAGLTQVAHRLEGERQRPAGPLSEREAQVLCLIAAGKTNRAIAQELFIAEKTVARHVSNIFDKLGLSSRAAATAWAYEHHLV